MTTAHIEDFIDLELVQGSSEWLESRKNYVGASEASVIMCQNKYKTPYQLYQQKTGISLPDKENFAMTRGKRLEPQARKQFELMSGIDMPTQPVIIHPEYDFIRVSLDGISECGKFIAEIKCPMSMTADSHMSALFGGVPLMYYAQVQLQLACCPSVEFAYYFSYDEHFPDESVIIEVARDQSYIDKMIVEIEKFWECVKTKTAPMMKEDEYENIELAKNKSEWQSVVSTYLDACEKAKEVLQVKEDLKNTIIKLSASRNVKGFGVSVCSYDKKGSVDYKKIPELRDVDVEKYRKDTSVVTTIRIV